MPNAWLPVPPYKQSRDGRCLPACVRMVLAYFGQERSEDELARLLQTRSFGTSADRIRLISQLGYAVTFEPGTESDLRRHLAHNLPCIIFLKTEALPYWKVEDSHAVVLVGMTPEIVYLNDPAFDQNPQPVPLQNFLLAWSEFDYEYAVIGQA
jgi:ABC-type bacteriocin/lantibiotic exporter with double-glycine peptidase domain